MATVLRTLIFVPADHARRVGKALTLDADAVILDLEDAVAVSRKPDARGHALAALGRPRRCRGYVRVNALSTPWGYGDLVAVVAPGVDGIVLPKVESEHEMRTAEWLVAALEREAGLPTGGIDLIPIIETAAGYGAMAAIARAGTRTRRLAFGAGDFTLDTGITWSRDELELLPYRSGCVTVSRAAGLEPPIDTVWTALSDTEGFAASVERARALGFQGKLCIHPDQVVVTNRAFTPAPEAVARARRILAAFEEAETQGVASIQLDGLFIDYPIASAARRVIARADAIAATETQA